MKHRTTLRDELEKEIAAQGHSLSHFSKISGINRGVLSATLNGNPPKPISIKQLDQMNQALQKQEGWLYEQFMNECFEEGKANWRRVRSLLIKLLELNNKSLIKKTLNLLTENISYLSQIFKFAEELTAKNFKEKTFLFYKCIITNERVYQSERLAISHYRIFRLSVGTDVEKNFRASITFAPFRHHLPDYLLLDALVKLGNISYTIEDWLGLHQYSDELQSLTQIIYTLKKNKEPNFSYTSERHLVVYYGKSYLFKFTALHGEGKYKEAESYISYFSDLSWFKDLDEEAIFEIERFKLYALFNKHNIKLLLGKKDSLDEYVNLIRQYPDQQLASLVLIFRASNIHDWTLDYLLEEYQHVIYPKETVSLLSYYNDYTDVRLSQYINLYYEIALYQCSQKKYDEKLEKILFTLESSVEKYNLGRMINHLELFRKLRNIPKDIRES